MSCSTTRRNDPVCWLHADQQRTHRLGLALGHATGGLVEQEHARFLGQHAGQLHDAPGLRELLDQLLAKASRPITMTSSSPTSTSASSDEWAIGVRRFASRIMALPGDRDGLGHGERREQAGLLERAAETGVGPDVGGPRIYVDTAQSDAPAVERQEPGHAVKEGGLAGTVVTDETEDLTVSQSERDVLNRPRMPPKRFCTPLHSARMSGASAGGGDAHVIRCR